MSNQKQIALGFLMWSSDNRDLFPCQVLATNGGCMEAGSRGYAAGIFLCLSNYGQNPKIYICPTDTNRISAKDFSGFRNQNASYFVAVDAGTNTPECILTSDRHLAGNGKPLKPGLFVCSPSNSMSWTRELHSGKNDTRTRGIMAFVDGHAESVQNTRLNQVFLRDNLATNRFCVP
jgi:prepilin-type processing-associated H-X9-DG protein